LNDEGYSHRVDEFYS